MSDTFKPKSKHIREASYDPATRTVLVTFHNGVRYQHRGVPQEAWDNWGRYRSAGEFYHGVIRRYPGAKLGK